MATAIIDLFSAAMARSRQIPENPPLWMIAAPQIPGGHWFLISVLLAAAGVTVPSCLNGTPMGISPLHTAHKLTGTVSKNDFAQSRGCNDWTGGVSRYRDADDSILRRDGHGAVQQIAAATDVSEKKAPPG
jgi:hypothetical protein